MQKRREAAVEERRLAGVLQLSTPERPLGNLGERRPPLPLESVDLEMKVLVRNDGPRDVTVTDASAWGFRLLSTPVPLPAQTTGELVMQQKADCHADTPPPSKALPEGLAAPGPLQVTVRTGRGTRTATIARSLYHDEHAAHIVHCCVRARRHAR